MKILDPSAPTEKEMAELKIRMLKGNLAMDLARGLVHNPAVDLTRTDSGAVANFVIGLAESIVDKFMSIEGNGGLIS